MPANRALRIWSLIRTTRSQVTKTVALGVGLSGAVGFGMLASASDGFDISSVRIPMPFTTAHMLIDDVDDEDVNRKHQVQTDHKLTKRELRFLQFASIEYDDVIYMSPMDFIDSLTLDAPRERVYRRVLKEPELNRMLAKTPPFRRGGKDLFRTLDQNGLISYSEYIFLLTLLTKSKSAFKIAFMMFDEDDSGQVDKNEFLVIRSLTSSLRSTKGAASNQDESCQLDPSDFQFVVSRIKDRLFQGTDAYTILFTVSKLFANRVAYKRKKNVDVCKNQKTDAEVKRQDTTLLLHMFGLSGNGMLSFDQFQSFCANLQEELMEIEFHEFSRGKETISPMDFARLILRYTIVNEDDYATYINRVLDRASTDDEGITLDKWAKFSVFLNNLEDFTTAVRLYTNADMPVSKKEFERAVRCTTGQHLDGSIIDMIYRIFDANNDGHLSYAEFLSVMNDRLHRGLRGRLEKSWGWKQYKNCVMSEVSRN